MTASSAKPANIFASRFLGIVELGDLVLAVLGVERHVGHEPAPGLLDPLHRAAADRRRCSGSAGCCAGRGRAEHHRLDRSRIERKRESRTTPMIRLGTRPFAST